MAPMETTKLGRAPAGIAVLRNRHQLPRTPQTTPPLRAAPPNGPIAAQRNKVHHRKKPQAHHQKAPLHNHHVAKQKFTGQNDLKLSSTR